MRTHKIYSEQIPSIQNSEINERHRAVTEVCRPPSSGLLPGSFRFHTQVTSCRACLTQCNGLGPIHVVAPLCVPPFCGWLKPLTKASTSGIRASQVGVHCGEAARGSALCRGRGEYFRTNEVRLLTFTILTSQSVSRPGSLKVTRVCGLLRPAGPPPVTPSSPPARQRGAPCRRKAQPGCLEACRYAVAPVPSEQTQHSPNSQALESKAPFI